MVVVSPRFSFTAFELSFSGVKRNYRDEVLVVVTDLSRRFFFDTLFPSVFFDLARSFGGPSFGMMGADDDSEFTAVRDLFAWVGRSLPSVHTFFP